MENWAQIIFVAIAIIYYIYKAIVKNDDEDAPRPRPRQETSTAEQGQSQAERLKEFLEGLEEGEAHSQPEAQKDKRPSYYLDEEDEESDEYFAEEAFESEPVIEKAEPGPEKKKYNPLPVTNLAEDEIGTEEISEEHAIGGIAKVYELSDDQQANLDSMRQGPSKRLQELQENYSPAQLAIIYPLIIERYEKTDPMKRGVDDY